MGSDDTAIGPNNVRIGHGAGVLLDESEENTLGGKDAGQYLVDSNDNTGWGYQVIGGAGEGVFGGAYPLLRTTTEQADPGLPHTTAISTLTQLQNMNDDLEGNYYLTCDIDASATSDPNYVSNPSYFTSILGDGFCPIGMSMEPLQGPFSGTFDGCGYTISNLYISSGGAGQPLGLFGSVIGAAKIANVTVTDAHMHLGDNSGVLIGVLNAVTGETLVQNCHTSGILTNRLANDVAYGGLIGVTHGNDTYPIKIYDCSSSVTVDNTIATSGGTLGGLIGSARHTMVYNCFATGDVIGNTNSSNYTGGLVGVSGENDDYNTFEYCYATGDVTGTNFVGGLIGSFSGNTHSYIRKCYSTGDVILVGQGTKSGGLVGIVSYYAPKVSEITDCYSWSDIINKASTYTYIGGFAGQVCGDDTFSQCYSIGNVPSKVNKIIGGFVAGNDGSGHTAVFSDTYWDTQTSGQAASYGGVGHITSWLQTKSNYPETWDFENIWYMPPDSPDVHRVTALGAYAASSVAEGADDGLYLGTYSGAYNTTDPNRFFLDNLDRGDYAGNQQHGMMYGYFDVDPNDQCLTLNVGELNLDFGRFDVNDVNIANDLTVAGDTYLADVNITGNLDVNDVNITILTIAGFDEGSVLFTDVNGLVTQDNANFNYDDANDVLDVNSIKAAGLTASRLVATGSGNVLESTDANDWIDGTTNQVTVTDDADGTVTLSTPQDIDPNADVSFNSIDVNSITLTNTVTEFSTDGTFTDNSDSAVPTEKAVKTYVDAESCPTYKYIKAVTQAEGDLHLSDGSTWACSKAFITTIRVVTSSTDWDLYVLQNDNGYAADDANIGKFCRVTEVSGNATLMMNLAYEDEDASNEVHLYYNDDSGANTADFYIFAYEMD
jgi:hypothetical protein